jgi:hypothetical protein
MDLQYLLDRRIDVIVAGRFAVEDLDWERSTGNVAALPKKRENWYKLELDRFQGERQNHLLSIHCGRSHNELEVSSSRKDWESQHRVFPECKWHSLFRSKPISMSVLNDRSWASSRMMQVYRSRSPSLSDSRSSTPSVISDTN